MSMGPGAKMLAAVGVLFFVAGVSESVILTKCELKHKLEAVGLTFPKGVLNDTNANFLAKGECSSVSPSKLVVSTVLRQTMYNGAFFTVVCHVQLTSGFNTSAIKQITNQNNHTSPNAHSGEHGIRRARAARKAKGKPPMASNVKPTPPKHEDSGEQHEDDDPKLWTLYGLFQLSDGVACNSTHVPSLNLCKMSCSSEFNTHFTVS